MFCKKFWSEAWHWIFKKNIEYLSYFSSIPKFDKEITDEKTIAEYEKL